MSATRRDFLVSGLSAGAALPLLGNAVAPSWLSALTGAASNDHVAVFIQIRGGWDFHNILIPADDPIYYAARPAIGIPKAITLPVQSGASVYWHPALSPFKALFDQGDLAVVQTSGTQTRICRTSIPRRSGMPAIPPPPRCLPVDGSHGG